MRAFFSWYWALWVAAFLIPELWWVWRDPRGTLSDTVWSLERLNMRQPLDFRMWTATHWTVALVVWLLFLWLSVHLPFGLLR